MSNNKVSFKKPKKKLDLSNQKHEEKLVLDKSGIDQVTNDLANKPYNQEISIEETNIESEEKVKKENSDDNSKDEIQYVTTSIYIELDIHKYFLTQAFENKLAKSGHESFSALVNNVLREIKTKEEKEKSKNNTGN